MTAFWEKQIKNTCS